MTDKQKKRKKVSKNYVIFEISNTQDGRMVAFNATPSGIV